MALSKIDVANMLTGATPIVNGGTGASSFTKGKVLQIVNARTGTEVTSNTATYVDTGLTATITPSSTSNKILVVVQQSAGKQATNTWGNIRLYRDSTEIGGTIPARSLGYTGDSTNNYMGIGCGITFLDTPSSTSALVYKTQFNNNEATGTIRVQVDSGQSFITLMEIEG